MSWILTVLMGCKDGTGVVPVDTGTSGADDTAVPEDTGDPSTPDTIDGWTAGPDLPDCTPQTGSGDRVALSGVLLTPDGPEAGVVIFSRSSGRIECVGHCDPTEADVLCTEGVISPGLINAHDHMQYNVLAPWQHDGLYTDRYDWQADGDYYDYRDAYDGIDDAYRCEIGKWAELRMLVSGSTAAIGSSGDACIEVLARNLDEGEGAHGIDGYDLSYSSGNVTGNDSGDASYFNSELASGDLGVVINHVAEGVDGSVRAEIDHMVSIGMSGPGYVYVHATDATTAQLAEMAVSGTGIVWSPRSNLDLYAATTEADVAMRLGVEVALGPDWTWSGSANPVREMACAADYLSSRNAGIDDVTLWEMTTTQPARMIALDGVLGGLMEGAFADIAVYSWSQQPYRAVIESAPEDVRLVTVSGAALYGVSELVTPLAAEPQWCETVSPCGGDDRLICVQSAESGDDAQTYAELESTLTAALAAESMPDELDYANDLFGLWVCEESRASCDVSTPTDDDSDGDGIADEDDGCPGAYDPLQADHDGDGEGDACDACPLAADVTDCVYDPDDIDGDTFENDVDVCPWLYDDQADSDGDGHGDVCDDCPDDANPGDASCPAVALSISAVRDPSHADHPAEGTVVTVEGVVIGVRDGYGFFIQDPDATEYAGIYVYDQGDYTVSRGERVSVEGTYAEYNGLSEIDAPTALTVLSTEAEPAPVSLYSSEVCTIGTGGEDAERYESMLVEVNDLIVSNDNPDGPDSDYNEFEVQGCLRIDDLLCESCWSDQPAKGDEIDAITGPLVYTYSNSKVVPREEADIDY